MPVGQDAKCKFYFYSEAGNIGEKKEVSSYNQDSPQQFFCTSSYRLVLGCQLELMVKQKSTITSTPLFSATKVQILNNKHRPFFMKHLHQGTKSTLFWHFIDHFPSTSQVYLAASMQFRMPTVTDAYYAIHLQGATRRVGAPFVRQAAVILRFELDASVFSCVYFTPVYSRAWRWGISHSIDLFTAPFHREPLSTPSPTPPIMEIQWTYLLYSFFGPYYK